jgi:hypothetical protein
MGKHAFLKAIAAVAALLLANPSPSFPLAEEKPAAESPSRSLGMVWGYQEKEPGPLTQTTTVYLSEPETRKTFRGFSARLGYELRGTKHIAFRLKGGESTDYWIRPPKGVRTRVRFIASSDYFKIEYKDGTTVRFWMDELPDELDDEFKIRAVFDVEGVIVVENAN